MLYMDNYFTSGPLVEELAQDKIYVAGTINQREFPEGLKSMKLSKGNYACKRLETYATTFMRTAIGCVLLAMSSLKQWRPRLCESS